MIAAVIAVSLAAAGAVWYTRARRRRRERDRQRRQARRLNRLREIGVSSDEFEKMMESKRSSSARTSDTERKKGKDDF